jgi:hypothetical protein
MIGYVPKVWSSVPMAVQWVPNINWIIFSLLLAVQIGSDIFYPSRGHRRLACLVRGILWFIHPIISPLP